MKRILFIALLFVNLQIVMTEGGISIGCMTASAQTMMYEMLDEIEVNGSLVDCKYNCGVRKCANEIKEHEEVCPERTIECSTCHISYKETDGHNCSREYTVCPICCANVLKSDLEDGRHSHDNEEHLPEVPPGGSNGGGGSSGGGGHGDSGKPKDELEKLNESLENILELICKMNPKIKVLINDLKASNKFVFDENVKNPRYVPNDKTIHLPKNETWISEESISHEMIHYQQHQLNMLDYDKCSSNNEFQTYLLNYMIFQSRDDRIFLPHEIKEEQINAFKDDELIGKDKNGLYFKQGLIEGFNKMNLNSLNETFFLNYQFLNGTDTSNSHSYDPNYDWKWEELLESVGFYEKKDKK